MHKLGREGVCYPRHNINQEREERNNELKRKLLDLQKGYSRREAELGKKSTALSQWNYDNRLERTLPRQQYKEEDSIRKEHLLKTTIYSATDRKHRKEDARPEAKPEVSLAELQKSKQILQRMREERKRRMSLLKN